MPSQGQSLSIGYSAYNTSTGAYVTGDAANHTLRLNKNGTVAAAANSPTEDDATNAPGQYSLVATSGETAFPIVKLEGKSSTANVIIIPTTVGFEVLPTALTAGSLVKADAQAINAVATTSVTAVSANVGTAQPVAFTGTGGSALVKSDMVDIAGAVVSTTTAQIGVNAVQVNGQTTSAAGPVTFPGTIASPTNITAGTITTVTNLTNAATAGDLTAAMKASVSAAILINPTNLLLTNASGFVTATNAAGPTAAVIATAVWQDATAGDFTTAGSIGLSLFTGVAPGATNGLFKSGTNASTTISGSGLVLSAMSIGGVSDIAQTGDSFARIGATGSGLTSLAPSATALSTANWTNTRAGYLDNLSGGPVALASSLPANFAALGITAAGKISEVVLVDTLTTYTGNTPQSGDTYAALETAANSEPTSVPAANAALAAKIAWSFALMRNKVIQTATTQTVYADGGATPIATSTVSDTGTVATRGQYS